MIHVFFIGYILSILIFQDFDKLGILIYGTIGLINRVKKYHIINLKLDILLLFITYLIIVSLFYSIYKSLFFGLLFLLQFGLMYYIYLKISKHGDELIYSWIKMFIIYQMIFIIIGLIDFILYKNGIISFMRNYLISWKVDSLYGNPNPFGIISGISFILLFYLKDLFKQFRKFYLIVLLMGVFLSGSDMALAITCIGIILKYFNLKLIYKVFIVLIILCLIYIMNADLTYLYSLFNKRIEIWIVAFSYLENNFILGIGTGSFQESVDSINNSLGINHNYGLHSMYLWLLIECGLVGLLLYAYFIFIVFKLDSFNDKIIKLFKKIFFLILLSQLTEFFIDHVEFFQLLYSLVIGIIFGKYYYIKNMGLNNAKNIIS